MGVVAPGGKKNLVMVVGMMQKIKGKGVEDGSD